METPADNHWVSFEEMLTPEICEKHGISEDRPLTTNLVRVLAAYRESEDNLAALIGHPDHQQNEIDRLKAEVVRLQERDKVSDSLLVIAESAIEIARDELQRVAAELQVEKVKVCAMGGVISSIDRVLDGTGFIDASRAVAVHNLYEAFDSHQNAISQVMEAVPAEFKDGHSWVTSVRLMAKAVTIRRLVIEEGISLYEGRSVAPHSADGPYKLMSNDPACGAWANNMRQALERPTL